MHAQVQEPVCEAEYKQLNRRLKQFEKDKVQIRKGEQQARLDLLLQQGERAGAQAIRNIMVAEATNEMGRQLRTLNPTPDQSHDSCHLVIRMSFSSMALSIHHNPTS
jgi:hypothetical protein